jgi:hypothetical protein
VLVNAFPLLSLYMASKLLIPIRNYNLYIVSIFKGVRSGTVGWGIALQAGRSRV